MAEKIRFPDSFAATNRLETSEGRLSVKPRFILLDFLVGSTPGLSVVNPKLSSGVWCEVQLRYVV